MVLVSYRYFDIYQISKQYLSTLSALRILSPSSSLLNYFPSYQDDQSRNHHLCSTGQLTFSVTISSCKNHDVLWHQSLASIARRHRCSSSPQLCDDNQIPEIPTSVPCPQKLKRWDMRLLSAVFLMKDLLE